MADGQGMSSIAIPTIGTGGIGLNACDVGREMIKVASIFAQQERKILQEIQFIVYPTDNNSYTAFQQALTCNLPIESITQKQQELIKMLTVSSNHKAAARDNCRLLFAAQCITTKIPVDLHVYYGNINDATTDAIIDVTNLCSKHTTTDNHIDITEYTDMGHTSQTLRCRPSTESNHSIYQVCPYGCRIGFPTILACISAREEKSVAIPLLNIEMNAAIIDSQIDMIESYVMNYMDDNDGIICLDFFIGDQDRSREISSWIQDKFMNKTLQLKWRVDHKVSVENLGMNIYYVAQDKSAISNIKSNMLAYANTWTYHKMDGEDYFNSLDATGWRQLALTMWSEHSTILSRQSQNTAIYIYGFETDILNTVSAMHKISKTYLEEKAHQEVQQFAAEAIQWYAIIGSSKIHFDAIINYELEKNYKIYSRDQTNKLFQIDSNTKMVDYEEMKIIHIAERVECPIRKSMLEEISIPHNWEYDKEESIKDGYYCLVDVQNQQEINEISNIPGLGGISINKVQRIQNWNLYRRYQIMKAEVTEAVRKYKPGTEVEKRLFHGTDSSKLTAICKSGFDRDYSGSAAGCVHGTGTYFAINAQLSQQYGNALLLVRVLTGVYAQSSGSGKPNLSIIPGSKSERVHSVVDNINSPSMHVVSNDNSAYPEYILHI